ncbi:MAG: cadherin-like beta sandwich domain-containing protein [Spirochaetaceae bacterium]|jgi:hypothetical protein|nr:cadherin-like beta sandwich domain-containing protein [Spirochaetaceae bacterium]
MRSFWSLVVAAFAVLTACNSPGGLIQQGKSEDPGFLISIGASAQGKVFSSVIRAHEDETVSLYVLNGKPSVISEESETIAVMGGQPVTDTSILGKYGISSAKLFTFIMPAASVTVDIKDASVDSSDVLLKSFKITEVISDAGGGSSVNTIYYNGAPSPSNTEFQAPSGADLTVNVTFASGVTLKYSINDAEPVALEEGASFIVPAITAGGFANLKFIASRAGKTVEYPVKICTWEIGLSGDADLRLINISDEEEFDPNIVALNFNFEANVSEVKLKAVTNHAGASLTLNGGAVTSNSVVDFALNNFGGNAARYVVTSEDGQHTKTYDLSLFRKKSSNALLARLDVDAVGQYGFSPVIKSYDLSANRVFYLTTTVTITPVAADKNAKIEFNGNAVESGDGQLFVLGNMGDNSNDVTITVTAQDDTQEVYTLKLYRNPSLDGESPPPFYVDGIEFRNPGIPAFSFNKETLVYDLVSSPVTATSIGVVVTASEPESSILLNGKAVTSGAETSVDLKNTGSSPNLIAVTIVHKGGWEKTYTIKVYRAASDDALLKFLAVTFSSGSVPLNFAPNVTEYNMVDSPFSSDIYSVKIDAEANHEGAKISINGNNVGSAGKSDFALMSTGPMANSAVITVTAQDGVTTKTYNVKLYKSIGSDSSLISIDVDGGGLTIPSFNPNYFQYNLNTSITPVQYTVKSIKVIPTASSPSAEISIEGCKVVSGSQYEWELAPATTIGVTKNELVVRVKAQDGSVSEYTLVVYRNKDVGDNANLERINAGMDGKINVGARAYPIDYYERDYNGSPDEWVLHSYQFNDKLITVDAVAEDPQAIVSVDKPNIEFNGRLVNEWDEAELDPPIHITVTAHDRSTVKIYKITKLILTPGKDAQKTPMAKGGKIYFVNGGEEEVHEWYETEQGKSYNDTLKFFGRIPPEAWIFVHGGGGAGGGPLSVTKKTELSEGEDEVEFDSGGNGGGGGGAGGSVIENTKFALDKRSYAVIAGKGGVKSAPKVDHDGKEWEAARKIANEDGADSKFGAVTALGGGGGYSGLRNKDGINVISGTFGAQYFVLTSPDYEMKVAKAGLDENGTRRVRNEGGWGGDTTVMWDVMAALGSSLVGSGPWLLIVVGLHHFLQMNVPAAVIILVPVAIGMSSAWIPFKIGGGGGAGAGAGVDADGRLGKHGNYSKTDGGVGGYGWSSSITGLEKEYGKGGKGGASGGDEDTRAGQGGNAERITETNESNDAYRRGGNGTVVVRYTWM